MIIKTYADASAFLQRTQTSLERHEAANSLMLGVCLRLQQFPEYSEGQPYLAAVEDGEELVAAAMMTPPHNLVVFSESGRYPEAFEAIARNLAASGWSLPGVNGPSPLSRAFAETWAAVAGMSYAVKRALRAFELRKVVYRGHAPGRLRVATEEDFDLTAFWALAFNQEALGEHDELGAQIMAKRAIQNGNIYLWEDGRPVSMAAKARPTAHGVTVNLVYTPLELRGRGYATACVAHLSQRLLDDGWQFCTLFTDLSNPTSNNIYQKIGYRPVCDFTEFAFEA